MIFLWVIENAFEGGSAPTICLLFHFPAQFCVSMLFRCSASSVNKATILTIINCITSSCSECREEEAGRRCSFNSSPLSLYSLCLILMEEWSLLSLYLNLCILKQSLCLLLLSQEKRSSTWSSVCQWCCWCAIPLKSKQTETYQESSLPTVLSWLILSNSMVLGIEDQPKVYFHSTLCVDHLICNSILTDRSFWN